MSLVRLLKKMITPKEIVLFLAMQILSKKLKTGHLNKLLLFRQAVTLFKKANAVKQAGKLAAKTKK